MFAWTLSEDIALVKSNPVVAIPTPKPPNLKVKAISQDDTRALMAAADSAAEKRRAKARLIARNSH